jgi:putative hydrolase of the HAD superfamily
VIKAITFDLWNTLFENISYSNIRLDILTKYINKKKSNILITDVQKLYNKYFNFVNPQFKTLKYHHIYTSERILHLFYELEILLSSEELYQIVNEFESIMLTNPPGLKKGVKDTLHILSQEYKLGIISDTGITPGRIIRMVLERYGILKIFNTMIFSDEIGYYKPHSKVFETALNNLRCYPEHSIHIGDLLETDIKGAKNYKMHTIWIRNSLQKEYTEIQPDYEIDEISEVIEIIKKINVNYQDNRN